MEKTIQYNNKNILYRSIGNGKPVMLVHGFGEDGDVWKNQIDYLKDKFYLIVPDLPGSGRSEMIDDMSMEGMAEVLHSIIHEENFETCSVIGHSMGGYITLALVEHYWNHVNAFGLFHSTAFADTEEKKETRKKGIEFIKQHGGFEFLKTSTPNLFSPNTKSQSQLLSGPNLITDFISTLTSFSADALIAYYNAMMKRPDRTTVLKNTDNPVLFIAGEHDNAVPLNDVLKQCHLPEKSYFHVLRKSGHMGMLEEPEKANRILEEFLLNEN
ncbi:MAG TPA: alpha/beta hydrolase [Chitinophagaceae bacterium]|nr:alpha/beta hydrolase [Chitinophagaceae bacterium]